MGLILDPFYSYIKLLIYLGMRLVIEGGCTFRYSTTKSSTLFVSDKPLSRCCLHKLNACFSFFFIFANTNLATKRLYIVNSIENCNLFRHSSLLQKTCLGQDPKPEYRVGEKNDK
uniref:Uncharacterized protein n=1 Tax=Micrurus lemniscatus lemniscatus TaxID=129467 RepID=A0A2D4I288_MICLE